MMTSPQPASMLKRVLLPGDPVSLDEAARIAGVTTDAASRTLQHVARQGVVAQVRRRLWVRTGAAVDPYRLAARITAPYAFAYGSALALNGAGPAERSEVLVSSPRRFEPFEYQGLAYRHVHPWNADGLVRVTVGPESVWVTCAERTIVDCVRLPANAGGLGDIMRAVDALPVRDPDAVLRWVDHYGEATLAARLGFVLESSGLYDGQRLLRELEARRPLHVVYLEAARRGGRLAPRWNLVVPPYMLPAGE